MIHESRDTDTRENKHNSALGQRLRQAREAKQWSIEHVAERLHLTRQRVIDLENDQYKNSSAETYAKGYLRGYAKLLGICADEIIDEFDRHEFSLDIERRTPQLIETKQVRASDRPMKYATYAISVTLVLMVGFWWHSQRNAAMVATRAPVQTTVELPVPAKVTLQSTITKPLPSAAPAATAIPAPTEEADEQTQAALMQEESKQLSQASPISSEALRKG